MAGFRWDPGRLLSLEYSLIFRVESPLGGPEDLLKRRLTFLILAATSWALMALYVSARGPLNSLFNDLWIPAGAAAIILLSTRMAFVARHSLEARRWALWSATVTTLLVVVVIAAIEFGLPFRAAFALSRESLDEFVRTQGDQYAKCSDHKFCPGPGKRIGSFSIVSVSTTPEQLRLFLGACELGFTDCALVHIREGKPKSERPNLYKFLGGRWWMEYHDQ
jgi:hypothetical protein